MIRSLHVNFSGTICACMLGPMLRTCEVHCSVSTLDNCILQDLLNEKPASVRQRHLQLPEGRYRLRSGATKPQFMLNYNFSAPDLLLIYVQPSLTRSLLLQYLLVHICLDPIFSCPYILHCFICFHFEQASTRTHR